MSLVAETATLVHGYTMADLDRAARIAAGKSFSRVLPEVDRYEAAWHAIAELLYSAPASPTFRDLLDAGRDAINRENKSHWQNHGISQDTRQHTGSYERYWEGIAPTVGRHGRWPEDFTEAATERLALPQVLGLLNEDEYEAIATLAVHGSRRAAMTALGIGSTTLDRRLTSARRRIVEAWFAPDRPPQREAGKCKWGHSWAEHGYLGVDGKRRCRECKRRSSRLTTGRGHLPAAKAENAERDRKICELWTRGGLTLVEIGRRMDCSASTASRVIRRDLGLGATQSHRPRIDQARSTVGGGI